MLSSASYVLLSCSASDPNWNGIARQWMHNFVEGMAFNYGNTSVIYNVHSLLHISDDAKNFGGLDNVSAFPFENYLQFLKSLVRSKRLMLEQVVKRVTEHDNYNFIRDRKIIKRGAVGIKNGFARKYYLPKFSVGLRKGDNCFVLSNDQIVLVDKIKICSDHRVTVVVRKVLWRTDISRYPIRSSKLNIFKCGSSVSDRIELNILDLRQKCVMLPFRNDINSFVCIPMLENYAN